MLLCFSVLEFILGGAGLVFDFEGDHSKSPDSYSQIIYNTNLISETIQFLESNTCLGLEIIVNNEINYEVFTILQKKYNNGEKFDKLEGIITDVPVYQIGGYKIDGKVNSESDVNENSFEKVNKKINKLTKRLNIN